MISYIVDVAACCFGILYGIYIIILNGEIYCYTCLSILWHIGCIIKFFIFISKVFGTFVLSWLRSDLTGNPRLCSNFLSFNIIWISYKVSLFYKEWIFYGNFIYFILYYLIILVLFLYGRFLFSQTMWLTGLVEELLSNQFC